MFSLVTLKVNWAFYEWINILRIKELCPYRWQMFGLYCMNYLITTYILRSCIQRSIPGIHRCMKSRIRQQVSRYHRWHMGCDRRRCVLWIKSMLANMVSFHIRWCWLWLDYLVYSLNPPLLSKWNFGSTWMLIKLTRVLGPICKSTLPGNVEICMYWY